MTAPDLIRKVRQLDNDVQSIYEILTTLSHSVQTVEATQRRHTNRLDELASDVTSLRTEQAAQGAKLDRILDILAKGTQ